MVTSGGSPSTSGILGLEWSSTGTERFYVGYAVQLTGSDSSITYTSSHLDLFFYGNAASQSATVSWFRDRADPPGGVMPSTSFSSSSGLSLSYVPVTLTNNQGSATPTPFQQMVTWDPADYSTYEAANLGNVRFCADTACQTPLYAWLESCSSTCSTSGSSSTSATAWVKLTSAIAGSGGTLTIYMVFEPTSTNFDGNYWGEEPQLSSVYAQYDNGANVFTAYFDGNTATSNFAVNTNMAVSQSTGVTGPGGATINAIHFSGYAGSGAEFEFSTALSNAGMIVESSFANANIGTATGVVGLLNNGAPGSVTNGINAGDGFGSDFFSNTYYVASAQTNANNQGTGTTAWEYGSVTYAGTAATSWSAYIAPQLYSTTGGYTGTVSNNPLSAAGNLYMGGGFGSSTAATRCL